MSVYLAANDGNAELCEVLGAADVTNHAIPSVDELTSAFTKLKQHGIIELKKNNFIIEKKFLESLKKSYNSKGGLFETANKGKKWLVKNKLLIINDSIIEITEEQLTVAHTKYIQKN